MDLINNHFLLFRFVAFIVHASIFCPRYSQKQSANQPKNTGECFTRKLKSTCKNLGTFEGKRILTKKVTYDCLAPSHLACVAGGIEGTCKIKFWRRSCQKQAAVSLLACRLRRQNFISRALKGVQYCQLRRQQAIQLYTDLCHTPN